MILYKDTTLKSQSQVFLVLFLEKLIKEQNLIINGVIPILSIMRSRAGNKIMINLSFQQAVMQILVHIQEEIAFSTIDNDSYSPNCLAMSQFFGNGRISIPPLVLPPAPNVSL